MSTIHHDPRWAAVFAACLAFVVCGCSSGGGDDLPGDGGTDGHSDGSGSDGADPADGGGDGQPDGTGEVDSGGSGAAPGSACRCDAECRRVATNEAVCFHGVCMNRATGPCWGMGSPEECPPGGLCWSVQPDESPICFPACATYDCDGVCGSDGACVPGNVAEECDPSCGSYCS